MINDCGIDRKRTKCTVCGDLYDGPYCPGDHEATADYPAGEDVATAIEGFRCNDPTCMTPLVDGKCPNGPHRLEEVVTPLPEPEKGVI